MAESVSAPSAGTESAIRRIQWFTIIWMGIEVAVAVLAAIRSNSVALAAFGGDSAIELLSAVVVLTRFGSPTLIAIAIGDPPFYDAWVKWDFEFCSISVNLGGPESARLIEGL